MPASFGGGGPSLLRATVKAAAVIAFLSLAATHWLSTQTLDRQQLAGLVRDTTRPGKEPVTTGSLAEAAQTRLDPCTGRAK